jgi:hypothetical protein
MTELELRARRYVHWCTTDEGAKWAFRVVLLLAIPIYFIIGRHQWFTRDDWALVLTRETIRRNNGWQSWLFVAQDGHWLALPTLIYHVLFELFGLRWYWPYLLTAMASHVGAVLLARAGCRRLHVTEWTTTLVCSMLIVFGSGFDNIVFAIQVCYNLSLIFFLAQLLLVDHDGPIDGRDYLGAVLGVLGMMTSGFGPIFVVGIATLLILRRRWKALAVAVVPQGLVFGWWLLEWYSDNAADKRPGDRALVPLFFVRGVTATFEAMVAFASLAGVAILGVVALTLWRGISWPGRRLMIAWSVTVVVMFLAVGWGRIGFGVVSGGSSRYVHVAAIIIAPAFALAVDQLGRIATEARWAGRLVLLAAVGVNLGLLRNSSAQWAINARAEQRLFELVAGSDLAAGANPAIVLSTNSPDVNVSDLPELVRRHAITPRQPSNQAEEQDVRKVLGIPGP